VRLDDLAALLLRLAISAEAVLDRGRDRASHGGDEQCIDDAGVGHARGPKVW
jgi:hypothetical protein